MMRHIPGLLAVALLVAAGCSDNTVQKQRDFHTSGNREADQRADQRIAAVQQMRGEGEGQAGQKSEYKKSLYERLGGDAGLNAIVDDFVTRAVADPRVNFSRAGIKRGGVMGVGGKPVDWQPAPQNLQVLKKHLIQFLALATGGPAKYDGQDMQGAHSGMKISNAEFDATVGDMKASLDAKQIDVVEQKELLAILESTRPQIVEKQ